MEQTPTTVQDIVKATEEKLGTWDVMSMTHEQQVAWAKTQIPERMVQIMNANDQPLQLVVHERLFDAVTEALQDVEIPTTFSPQLNEGELSQFKEFCRSFPVRSAKTEEMAVPPTVEVPCVDQFVVFLTLQGQQINYLRQFDQRLGISQYLVENRIPLALTQEDMLQMVKFFVLLQCINRAAQTQVQAAKAQDLSGQIFRP